MTHNNKKQNRREFFRAAGRGAALGALAGAGVLLALRGRGRQAVDPEKHRCINRGICKGCSRFSGCSLPAATSAKKAGVKA